MRFDTSEWISEASASISSFTRDIAGGVVAEEEEAVEAEKVNFASDFFFAMSKYVELVILNECKYYCHY